MRLRNGERGAEEDPSPVQARIGTVEEDEEGARTTVSVRYSLSVRPSTSKGLLESVSMPRLAELTVVAHRNHKLDLPKSKGL